MAQQKILVIDDSRVIRMRVKEMLPAGKFEVLEAANGLEGLDLIRQTKPNWILLDFLLPKMSGWEVYQEVQKHPQLRFLPLVLMSGRKEEVTEKLPEPFKHFAFVNKPFDKKQLFSALKEAMHKAEEYRRQGGTEVVSDSGGASTAEIDALKQKVAKMEAEINGLKKQLAQLVGFIKQKLK